MPDNDKETIRSLRNALRDIRRELMNEGGIPELAVQAALEKIDALIPSAPAPLDGKAMHVLYAEAYSGVPWERINPKSQALYDETARMIRECYIMPLQGLLREWHTWSTSLLEDQGKIFHVEDCEALEDLQQRTRELIGEENNH